VTAGSTPPFRLYIMQQWKLGTLWFQGLKGISPLGRENSAVRALLTAVLLPSFAFLWIKAAFYLFSHCPAMFERHEYYFLRNKILQMRKIYINSCTAACEDTDFFTCDTWTHKGITFFLLKMLEKICHLEKKYVYKYITMKKVKTYGKPTCLSHFKTAVLVAVQKKIP
jgi:hypothetical protein